MIDNKNKSKIAILMSTYNGEKYIKCQIDSIMNQQLNNEFTIFIRDDGSTDNTIKIIESYEDNRIVLFQGENKGVNYSYLELIKIAKNLSKDFLFFSFSDQDDQWHLNKLSIAIDSISKELDFLPVLYGSASLHVDSNLIPLELNIKRSVYPLTIYNTLIQNIIPGHTYVFNRNFLNLIPNDLDYSRIYFYDAFLLNIANMSGKLIYDPYRYTNYRQHENNVCGNQTNVLNWMKLRCKRINKGDSVLYAKQIEYLYELYGENIDIKTKNDILDFLNNRKSFFTRFCYIIRCKFYRQSKWQTFMFKLLYLLGGYNNVKS